MRAPSILSILLVILLGLSGWLIGCETLTYEKAKPAQTVTPLLIPTQPTKTKVSAERKVLDSQKRILDQSHQVFTEGWALLFGRGFSIPNSAFRALKDRLQLHLREDGVVASETQNCPIDHTKLLVMLDAAGAPTQIQLLSVDCRTQGLISEVATFTFLADRAVQLRIVPRMIPEGVGESMALLNDTIECHYTYDNLDRLDSLSCKNLGQNLERLTHLKFQSFEYTRTQNQLLKMQADKYHQLTERMNCDAARPCYEVKVPLEGRITVVENRKMTIRPPLPVPPPLVKVAPEQPQAQSEQKVEDNGKEQNKNQNKNQPQVETEVQGELATGSEEPPPQELAGEGEGGPVGSEPPPPVDVR